MFIDKPMPLKRGVILKRKLILTFFFSYWKAKEAAVYISDLSLELVQLIFTEIEKLSTLAADQFSDFIKDNYLPPLLSQTVNLKKILILMNFRSIKTLPKLKV